MKRKDASARFHRRLIPSAEAIRRWSKSSGPACEASQFMPDLNGTAGSDWNKSVAKVFAESFVQYGQFNCKKRTKIAAAFRSHLRGLINKYKESLSEPSPQDLLAEKERHNRYQRKLGLYERRLQTCGWYDQLRRHATMLRKLGPGGMSSDEPDGDSADQYVIIQQPWRSHSVARWLRVMDQMYARLKNPPGQPPSRGAPVRRRVTSDRNDGKSPAVRGLPINIYEAEWYAKLSEFEKQEIGATTEAYDLSHDNVLLQ
ncbi:uncharacterized protein B0H18DRAFT_878840 [Fomitopsis serialis]|uniref:uncharacterized protein n=1 Tax=Fomitopsis serialis TaxID=139415 RepID=UPI002007A327|nr:uncharacterized protein B0H18DRAFT_878840 [Neoantrodia serialis]KAH9923229.1 hypothetical protein B0H18DRAFT_878840 [Neoantrodia serialis]